MSSEEADGFVLRFEKPQTKRDWRSLGAFCAFVVAEFPESSGSPRTIERVDVG
jgi:hypothetical protein